jgi:hypothetical protein
MFLRKGSNLPAHFDLSQEPCGDDWMLLEEIEAHTFDTMIRQVGWHLLYGRSSCSRTCVGRELNETIHRALVRALKGIPARFSAAEFDSVQVAKHLGFHFATIVLLPRHIQQYCSLDAAATEQTRIVPAR